MMQSRPSRFARLCCALGLLALGAAPRAQADIFVTIEGIPGDSTDEKYKNTIPASSFSLSLAGDVNAAQHGGGGAGKTTFKALTFVHPADAASPKLMEAMATGKPISTVTVYVRKPGAGRQETYYTLTLRGVVIESVHQTVGAAGIAAAKEYVSVRYDQINWEVSSQSPTGAKGSSVKGGWDVKNNRALSP
jgi:type VI secretion system secreted protein Hcp